MELFTFMEQDANRHLIYNYFARWYKFVIVPFLRNISNCPKGVIMIPVKDVYKISIKYYVMICKHARHYKNTDKLLIKDAK